MKTASLIFLFLAASVGAQDKPVQKVDPSKSTTEKEVTARKYFAEAVALAETIPDLKDKAEAITAIAGMEWRSGEHEQATHDFELVRKIISRTQKDGEEDAIYLLNWMDLDRARAGDIEGALKHASSMNTRERNNLYAAMAEHSVETGDLSAAFSRISMMEKEEGSPGQTDIMIEIFYTALGEGNVKDALEIAERINDSHLKAQALCVMAGQVAKLGRADEASRNLQEALSLAALQPNDNRGSPGTGIRDDLRTKIAVEQATIGHPSEAFDTIDLITDANARDSALYQIAQVFSDAGDPEAVRKAVGRTKDSTQKSWVALQVPLAMAKAGDFDGALRIARGTEESKDREMLLFEIAKIRLDKGDRSAALAQLREVANYIDSLSDEASRGYDFIEIGKMQLAAGDQAAAVVSLAKTATVPTNFRVTPGIVEAQVLAGDVVGALRTAGPPRPDYYNQYYGKIAFTQARCGKYQDALAWVEALKFPYEKAMTLANLASGILEVK
jgi:tetratricopeptide (TPR) repeat protein